MKRRLSAILILTCTALLLSACGGGNVLQKKNTSEPASEDDSVRVFESDFGYSMEYDPGVFYVLTDNTSDSFGLWNEDVDADLSVSVNVERVRGYSVSEYTDIVTTSAESGVWSVTEAEFGAEHEDATTVVYEESTDAGLVYHAVTLVKDSTDLLVVETVTYEGLAEDIAETIRNMLMTFRCK